MEVSPRRRCLWQPWLTTDNFQTVYKPGEHANESDARSPLFYCAEERPKTTNLHRKPSSAWRKERRRDPIQSEALDMTAARVHHHHHSRPSVIVPTTPQPGTTIEDTAVTPTPSLTPSAAAGGQRTGVRTVGGVSDPAIDEHFKRSLGLEEYAAVFNATTTDKEAGLSGRTERERDGTSFKFFQWMITLRRLLEKPGRGCRQPAEARTRPNCRTVNQKVLTVVTSLQLLPFSSL
ncbi:hypothetical protein E2986_07421 [Frieseomelitta varia]|uniref:Uncharacterized protein n=1 Tax=Frieseomelitta varia TaxID=561572 RepID=A0A833W867_9HYME|nr:hypothetical protein E2986_07421 [Frieseomelitta varia]